MKGLALGLLRGGLITFLLATQALAADPAKPAPPAELIPKVRPTTKSFYGWEILATGEVGGILAASGVLLPETPLGSAPATAAFITGMPLYALGGPAVHWSHGDFSKGLVSFGGNLVLPFIGGFTGRAIRCNETNAPDDCGSRGFLTGVVVAAMIAPVVDAFVLGWEDIPVEDALSPAKRRLGAIAPWSTFDKNGQFQVGLSGRF
jgi:hypothetical protein